MSFCRLPPRQILVFNFEFFLADAASWRYDTDQFFNTGVVKSGYMIKFASLSGDDYVAVDKIAPRSGQSWQWADKSSARCISKPNLQWLVSFDASCTCSSGGLPTWPRLVSKVRTEPKLTKTKGTQVTFSVDGHADRYFIKLTQHFPGSDDAKLVYFNRIVFLTTQNTRNADRPVPWQSAKRQNVQWHLAKSQGVHNGVFWDVLWL